MTERREQNSPAQEYHGVLTDSGSASNRADECSAHRLKVPREETKSWKLSLGKLFHGENAHFGTTDDRFHFPSQFLMDDVSAPNVTAFCYLSIHLSVISLLLFMHLLWLAMFFIESTHSKLEDHTKQCC